MATFAAEWKYRDAAGHPMVLSGKSVQDIDEVSAVQNYALGTRVKGYDAVLGEAEFIYCKGVAATAAGDVVTINPDFTTTRSNGAAAKGAAGVAMAALVADRYGWYCIKGRCVVTIAADVTANLPAYVVDATAGIVADDIVATNHVVGMVLEAALDAGGSAIVGTTATTAAHKAVAFLNYPYVVGAV
jgi:hypothetical protein